MTTATATAQAELDQLLIDKIIELGVNDYNRYIASYNTVRYQSDKIRKTTAEKYGIDKKELVNWINTRRLRGDDGHSAIDNGQSILDGILADHGFAPAKPAIPAKPSVLDDLLNSDDAKDLMKMMNVNPDQFLVMALQSYIKQSKGQDLSDIPTSELMGSRKDGYGIELVERTVKFLIKWNGNQACGDLRYQITYPVIKAITKTATATMATVLGNPTAGIVGSLEKDISEHHAMMGMVSKVYNRGKDDVTNHIKAGIDF